MDDDNADWLSAATEPDPEPTPPPKPAGGAKAAAGGQKAAAPAGGKAPKKDDRPEAEPESDYLDPDKLLLFKHWIRPRYLQYKYIYDYRRSYYDNVLEAIESRRKGYRTNIPRPQTWAERVLRTHSDPFHKLESFDRYLEDVKLVTRSEVSGRIYSQYNCESFNKRYLKL
ncbi:flightin isoform X2 [Rhynchophorus ferrugineus]|uniref:flightin isoform X2 n=1 Tax=Rhynchophorus ferrugineus TaxID=354439 RepID=UPI003FCD703F